MSRNSYSASLVDGEVVLERLNDQVYDVTEQSVDTTMFLTAGLEFAADHTLKATTLQIRKTDDRAGVTTGFLATEATGIRQTRLEWSERELRSGQIEHWPMNAGF